MVPAYGPSRRPQARRSGLPLDLFASRRARSRPSPSIWFAQRSPQARHPTQTARRILKGALIPIAALTRGFPLGPFGWFGTRRLSLDT
jgi:hypothetical protein